MGFSLPFNYPQSISNSGLQVTPLHRFLLPSKTCGEVQPEGRLEGAAGSGQLANRFEANEYCANIREGKEEGRWENRCRVGCVRNRQGSA
jgi:hypothetical protein